MDRQVHKQRELDKWTNTLKDICSEQTCAEKETGTSSVSEDSWENADVEKEISSPDGAVRPSPMFEIADNGILVEVEFMTSRLSEEVQEHQVL